MPGGTPWPRPLPQTEAHRPAGRGWLADKSASQPVPQWTTVLPPARLSSAVLAPVQSDEKTSREPSHRVIASESPEPGSPRSVAVRCSVKPPATDVGLVESVTSNRLAFDRRSARPPAELRPRDCSAVLRIA